MLFAAVHESAFGTKRTIAALQQFGRFWTKADIDQPLLKLCFRPLDLAVDDPSRFREGFGRR
jgi:hypothetical protein